LRKGISGGTCGEGVVAGSEILQDEKTFQLERMEHPYDQNSDLGRRKGKNTGNLPSLEQRLEGGPTGCTKTKGSCEERGKDREATSGKRHMGFVRKSLGGGGNV